MAAPQHVTDASAEERIDTRPRLKRMAGPLATGALVLAGTAFVRFVDPNEPGHYPLCPTQWLLGVDCPGCGGLRATHALANGDLPVALDHNALFVVLVPLLVVGWFVWAYRSWTGRRPPLTPRRLMAAKVVPIVIVIVAMVFTVVRNFVPFLGSGVG